MDGKYTPEWSAYAHGNNGASWGVGGPDGAEVALVRTTESDANLIAAAPELLAACKLALRDIEATLYLWPAEVSESPELIGARTRREVYAAAIRKAEGGEA